tara:strand:- start:1825 stop:2685 length:861 start_codon:yes stop_codon:yes gene_type:complete
MNEKAKELKSILKIITELEELKTTNPSKYNEKTPSLLQDLIRETKNITAFATLNRDLYNKTKHQFTVQEKLKYLYKRVESLHEDITKKDVTRQEVARHPLNKLGIGRGLNEFVDNPNFIDIETYNKEFKPYLDSGILPVHSQYKPSPPENPNQNRLEINIPNKNNSTTNQPIVKPTNNTNTNNTNTNNTNIEEVTSKVVDDSSKGIISQDNQLIAQASVESTPKKEVDPDSDLTKAQKRDLMKIRNAFGDYRKETREAVKAAGLKANRKRLFGPRDQLTMELMGDL